MEYRGRLCFVGLLREWGPGLGGEGEVVREREGGCAGGGISAARGSGRRGIGFRTGRGRRGLLRSRDVCCRQSVKEDEYEGRKGEHTLHIVFGLDPRPLVRQDVG